jgi:hypothetical protein
MRRLLQINLLLWGLLLTHQALWAQQEQVFKETFDQNNKEGGRDGNYGTSGTKPEDCVFDNEGWDNTTGKFYPASKCLKFGTGSANGVLSTPHISLKEGTTATLTFNAAGWTSGTNTLEISATGCKVAGDISLKDKNKLKNGEWTSYTVTISDITGPTDPVTITFTGKRGFLDDVVVTGEKGGEIVVTVSDPILTEEFTFWPNTTETTKRIVTITPAEGTTVRYTTDGSKPSMEEGTLITTATTLRIKETTTIKAIALKSLYTSNVVSKTYTLGDTKTSIADFAALADDTEMRLFLSAEQMASVTSVNDKKFTLKDNSGTIVVDFGTVPYNPTPEVNQRVAGWIIGKKQTIGGVTTMVATEKTTANYMLFAAPVTDPSAIQTINKDKEGDVIYYNVAGMRVEQPSKGVYIANGKKLIIH